MTTRPAVTVAIALHRSAPMVDIVSANIARITDDDVEILLSDCTGIDDAIDVLEARHGDDPRVTFVRGTENLGWVDHYNALLRRARGRYFMWMAHDDDFSPDYVRNLRDALDADPDVLLAFGTLRVTEVDGTPIDVPYLPELPVALGRLSRADEAVALLQRWNLGIPSRGLFRRDEILRRRLTIRHTRSDVDADAYWVLAIVASGRIVFVPACSVDKRVTPDSGSADWPRRRHSVATQLQTVSVMARHLLAARVPPRVMARVMTFVTLRAVQRALWMAPAAVREAVPARVRAPVGRWLHRMVQRAPRPDAPGEAGAPPLRVLFISSGAGVTGAPRVLLLLARNLAASGAVRPAFLLRSSGPLLDEFARIGPVATLGPQARTLRWQRGPVYDARVLAAVGRLAVRTGGFDLAYSNTITNGRILRALRPLRLPTVTHVHELADWVATFVTPSSLCDTCRNTDDFVACSDAVARYLHEGLRIDRERIHVVHGFVDAQGIHAGRRPGALRDRLGLEEGTHLVGGCGTLDDRKGVDLFLDVAARIRARHPALAPTEEPAALRFVWLGGNDADVARCRADADARGLADIVTFPGVIPGAEHLFTDLDVLLLTSREDPFPLVVLECACVGVPSIVFSDAGGAPEFVDTDAGVQVPYLDTDAMTDRLAALLQDPTARAALGAAAARKVAARHDVRHAAPRLLELMRARASAR